MSELRLYFDEDAGEHMVVQGLIARGFDILTTLDANRLNSTDEEQLAFAAQQGRAIYTFNTPIFLAFIRNDLPAGLATLESL